MTTDIKISRPVFLIVSTLTILLGGLLTFFNFSEWFSVSVLHMTGSYPFGGEGPTPYYYRTADLYSTVMLVWGILFLMPLSYGIWTIIKGQRARTILTLGLTLLLLVVMYIHG